MRKPKIALVFVLALLAGCLSAPLTFGLDLEKIKMPPGFEIEIFTDATPGARSMTLGDDGVVFVGTRSEGKVYAVIDRDGDGRAEKVEIVADGLNSPNGVAYRGGSLYVAEISRILRYDEAIAGLGKKNEPAVVTDVYPDEGHHGWKYIAFGPDGLLYVPVGAPCNVCEAAPIFSTITRLDVNAPRPERFAGGIRNTVGFDWHPATGELWFTNNGRDWMGDDLPPDTLHRAPEKDLNFGFPYCHAGDIPDPDFGAKRNCDEFAPPAMRLGPHVASLGMKFYTGEMFPEEYRNQIFIAEHGSWNRSNPIGYRVTLVRLMDGAPVGYETFAEGWLQGGAAWGRPVDVLVMPDGAMLVSDDRAGAIYRISYKK